MEILLHSIPCKACVMLAVNDALRHRIRNRPPHVNEWLAFSKIFTLESVFEKMRDSVIVFTEYKWTVGEIGRKKMRFQTKTEKRVDGFVLALARLAISHASCARLRVTDKITPLTTNQKSRIAGFSIGF